MLTNQEKRVEIYTNNQKPTDPSSVNSETPLNSLNLNWREIDLPEKARTKHVHRLHPYLGKFIPQLVEIFLRKYFKHGQTVLDPFCGSGTTLVQANELGINSIGFDISEFNVLLTKVKTAKYDLGIAKKEIHDILEKLRSSIQKDNIQLNLLKPETYSIEITVTNNEYLNRWFDQKARNELLTYKYLIDKESYKYKILMKVILSRSARSARLTTHFDLDFPKKPQTEPYYCYKHSRICKPTNEAFKFLRRYSLDTIRRLEEYSYLQTDAKVEVNHADCRVTDFPLVDGVITSPPYVGLIDYHEQHAYGYHLLNLDDNRDCEIGAAVNGSSIKAKEDYKKDIAEVFIRVLKAIPRGGLIIVIAGDRANLYDDIAKLVGIETEAIVKRHVNRRTGRRANEFYESVFIWKKK
ncbi:MAG: class I SAM-dependent methyltransferase [Candidatus Heimdallarchaeota archaeon]|nr:MAG: class I SAM-dependent methyltransferase [Candidatus Heimdallarchaeota archaeon]